MNSILDFSFLSIFNVKLNLFVSFRRQNNIIALSIYSFYARFEVQ